MVDSFTVNLNDLKSDGVIECPYCGRGKSYSYGAKGKAVFLLQSLWTHCFMGL
jgi:hypothetical protein